MTNIESENMYHKIIKESHLIIIYEDYCELSNYFLKNIKEINFEKIYFVDRKKNNILFNKLFFLSTPTIIFKNTYIYPGSIEQIKKFIGDTD
jgi:hypothetical protein